MDLVIPFLIEPVPFVHSGFPIKLAACTKRYSGQELLRILSQSGIPVELGGDPRVGYALARSTIGTLHVVSKGDNLKGTITYKNPYWEKYLSTATDLKLSVIGGGWPYKACLTGGVFTIGESTVKEKKLVQDPLVFKRADKYEAWAELIATKVRSYDSGFTSVTVRDILVDCSSREDHDVKVVFEAATWIDFARTSVWLIRLMENVSPGLYAIERGTGDHVVSLSLRIPVRFKKVREKLFATMQNN